MEVEKKAVGFFHSASVGQIDDSLKMYVYNPQSFALGKTAT
jgi:hypothetical protein